ncbi:MAG: glycosyltransferase [Planctomycetota bacterium]
MSESRGLYRKLVPFGSRRDRLAWITMVTLRKTREGPGPWLRAVKKGVYQLLPTRWQERVLKLKGEGQDPFFRQRTEVHHTGAAGGVEVPDLVSIVLPIYQQANMAAEAIESVLAQSYRTLELIVVDDGSTDGLHEQLRPYLRDPRVRVVVQPNQGLPKALSTGFDHATGEFFTWTSADNRMLPEQLTRLVAFLRARAEVAMVYGDYELIAERGQLLDGGAFRVMDRTDKSNLAAVRVQRSTLNLNRYEDNFIGACFLYRGQIGRLLEDYNPELGLEDYDYWMRINRLFCIEHLGTDEVLYQYRVHDNTLSARARELKILERAKKLMDYERERAEWFAAPFAQTADTDELAWLGELEPATERWQGTFAQDGAKRLYVLSVAEIAEAPLGDVPAATAIACWFSSPAEVYRAHSALRHSNVVAIAADAPTAARLAVFTRRVIRGDKDRETLRWLQRAAANGTFFRATRAAARLHRVVPQPMLAQTPLRVLLQLDTYGKGGLERVVEDLAICLLAAGCEIGILALDGSLADAQLPAGVERIEIRKRTAEAYAEMLREHRFDAVHAHASTFGADAAHGCGIPFVQVVHNSYVWFDRGQIESYREADAHTAAYACVSAQALGYADQRLGLDVQKMLVIENGIATPAELDRDAESHASCATALRRSFGFDEHDFVFLQVASLQPAKAHLQAVRALAELRQHNSRAKLLAIGNTRMNPLHAGKVQAEVRRLGLDSHVVLAGHRDDAVDCYAMADAFLLPSFWEGCSLAVWEAIRQDLPLVLTDVGAAREQLAHGRGELVAPPFASMFELDAGNLEAVVLADHAKFVNRLATAMGLVAKAPSTAADGNEELLPYAAERATMARRHLLLLGWLRQGAAQDGRDRATSSAVGGIRASIARAADAAQRCGASSD